MLAVAVGVILMRVAAFCTFLPVEGEYVGAEGEELEEERDVEH